MCVFAFGAVSYLLLTSFVAAFDAYDKDGNGVLDRDELEKFGQDCIKFLKKDVKKEEFFVKLMTRGLMLTMDQGEFINWCISECDTDGNGEVDWAEFENFVKTHDSWERFQIVEDMDIKETTNATLVSFFFFFFFFAIY
jgi:hypothetical protein